MTDIGVYTQDFQVEDRSWLGSRDGTDVTQGITLDISKFSLGEHYPKGYIPSGVVLGKVTSTGLYGPYKANTDPVQSLQITGNPTGGTFTITVGGQVTSGIPFNANAATVQAALAALSTVGAGNVQVTGGPGPDGVVPFGPSNGPGQLYYIAYVGSLGGAAVQTTTSSGSGLTGGSSPGVTITSLVTGGVAVSDGRATPVGFLFDTTQVGHIGFQRTPPTIGAPLHWRGVIRTSRLPLAAGLDAAAITALAGRFMFRTN